jgi:hypothetical protein
MVSSNYRGKGIFSTLLEKVKKNFSNKTNLLVMWPNNNNFASFGIEENRIIRKKYYLYVTLNRKTKIKKTFNENINNIDKLKIFIKGNNSFFLKNFDYFKSRYLLYKDKEYLINKFELNNFKSFFILKKNKDKSGFNYVILDHFGSECIKSTHLSQLINNESKLIFWSKTKINKSNLKLINYINLNIGFIKETDIRKQKEMLLNKEFMLGDTDSFITI